MWEKYTLKLYKINRFEKIKENIFEFSSNIVE